MSYFIGVGLVYFPTPILVLGCSRIQNSLIKIIYLLILYFAGAVIYRPNMINRNSSSRETKPLHDKRKFIVEFDRYIKIIYILERFFFRRIRLSFLLIFLFNVYKRKPFHCGSF